MVWCGIGANRSERTFQTRTLAGLSAATTTGAVLRQVDESFLQRHRDYDDQLGRHASQTRTRAGSASAALISAWIPPSTRPEPKARCTPRSGKAARRTSG